MESHIRPPGHVSSVPFPCKRSPNSNSSIINESSSKKPRVDRGDTAFSALYSSRSLPPPKSFDSFYIYSDPDPQYLKCLEESRERMAEANKGEVPRSPGTPQLIPNLVWEDGGWVKGDAEMVQVQEKEQADQTSVRTCAIYDDRPFFI